ncbi:MAG: WYL domain-containing protein [Rhodospirillales bacterium]|nr:WYL domain-containing protein [Rhodospirillales bacterium]
MPKKRNPESRPRDKLLSLYQRLTLDGRKHFQADIARVLECSPQTVARLIGVISDHLSKDVAIESGLEGRRRYYRLRSATEETALGFSFEELRYLAICRDLAAPFLSDETARRIGRSLTTLALQLGEGAGASLAGEQIGFRSKGSIDYTPHLPMIAALRQAIEKREVCDILYRAGGRSSDRHYRYAPGRILAMSGTLYVLGFRLSDGSLLAERPTTFSLHRVREVLPTGEYFRFHAIPDDSKAFGLIWHEPRLMAARIAPEAADYVRDRVWSNDQIIEDQPDGGIVLTIRTTSEREFRAWVGSFLGLAEIIAPPGGAAPMAATPDTPR